MNQYAITIKDHGAFDTKHQIFNCIITAENEREACHIAKDMYSNELNTDYDNIEILSIKINNIPTI